MIIITLFVHLPTKITVCRNEFPVIIITADAINIPLHDLNMIVYSFKHNALMQQRTPMLKLMVPKSKCIVSSSAPLFSDKKI